MSLTLTEITYVLARDAITLHRLAKAAEDVQNLKSPATNSRPSDGIPRPTEDTALCPRRAHVRDTSAALSAELPGLADRLASALDVWEGRA